MSESLFALILAGGSGERFWPLSRRRRPKQLLPLFSNKTLLEETLDRLDGLVPRRNILVLTNRDQANAIRRLLPDLADDQIIAEPEKRDTAAAIALGTAWVASRDPEATMCVLPADHRIADVKAFQSTLRTATNAARSSGSLVTIGIRPTWACPGFGYIEMGARFGETNPATHEVVRFREKPSPAQAAEYLEAGTFRWNAGIFIWTVRAITGALRQNAPELADFIEKYRVADRPGALLETAFSSLPKVSIDYAVMEKADRVLMVEAAFDWDDVGGWVALGKYLETRDGNAANTPLTATDAANNIIYSDAPCHVALVGVDDLIVVRSADALLVCHRDEAEKIRDVVRALPPELQ